MNDPNAAHLRLPTLRYDRAPRAPDAPAGDLGAVRAAGQAAMAANGLLGVHLLTRPDHTGRPAEQALLREFLREVKQHVTNTRRRLDRVLRTLRGRGV